MGQCREGNTNTSVGNANRIKRLEELLEGQRFLLDKQLPHAGQTIVGAFQRMEQHITNIKADTVKKDDATQHFLAQNQRGGGWPATIATTGRGSSSRGSSSGSSRSSACDGTAAD